MEHTGSGSAAKCMDSGSVLEGSGPLVQVPVCSAATQQMY